MPLNNKKGEIFFSNFVAFSQYLNFKSIFVRERRSQFYLLSEMYIYLFGIALLGFCEAEDSYAPVKYGGPIVYSGEKPPIIHFPPPPRDVSKYKSL